MKTKHSRKPKRRVTPRLGNKHYYFYKLQKVDQIDNFIGMIRSHVHELTVRKLLSAAGMGIHKPSQLELFERYRCSFICLNKRISLKDDASKTIKNFRRRDVAVSLFHELIHIELHHVMDIYNRWDNDEKLIEETAQIWADRFPEIVDIFEQVFDCGLLPTERGELKEGSCLQPFVQRPVCLQLELFDRRRLMPYELAPIIFE